MRNIKDDHAMLISGRRQTASMPWATSGRYPTAYYARPLSDTDLDEEIIYKNWEDLDADFEGWSAADELEEADRGRTEGNRHQGCREVEE